MNKQRRKEISDLIERFESLCGDVESILEEEEEYRDNIPENLQGSERYERAEEACDNISSALDSLDEVIEYLGNALE